MPSDSIFGSKGPGVFVPSGSYVIGVCNSRLAAYLIRSMTNDVDVLVEHIRSLPLPYTVAGSIKNIDDLSTAAVDVKKAIVSRDCNDLSFGYSSCRVNILKCCVLLFYYWKDISRAPWPRCLK